MRKVVVVDDTSITARLIGEFLKEVGDVEPVIFTNPVEGLEYCLSDSEVQMLLVDYQMPELDGLELIKRIREQRPQESLPIVMITATDEKSILREAFDAGANDFLRKPVEPIELNARVKNLLALKSMTEELHKLANTDMLTNVQTRRAFMEASNLEVNRSHRYGGPMSVVMLDADHFKSVNDTYGHAGGDDVLRFLSAECKKVLRDQDFIGRIGGEEFCICLPETASEGAFLVADRLRESIAISDIKLSDGQVINISISVGVATLQEKETMDDVMRRADEALYEAKETGRNRVVAAA